MGEGSEFNEQNKIAIEKNLEKFIVQMEQIKEMNSKSKKEDPYMTMRKNYFLTNLLEGIKVVSAQTE